MSTPPPDAPATRVACPQCATQLPCYNPASSRYFGCFKCRTYSWVVPQAWWGRSQRRDGFRTALVPGPSLPLGAVVALGGYQCRLTGYQVRGEKEDRTAEWHEYQLTPATPLPGDALPLDFPLQLAEYQGHWLLIRRAATFPAGSGPDAVQAKEWRDPATNRHYQLWHRYQPTIRDALGEFDWDILEDEQLKIQEFISPPYLLTSEQRGQEQPTWYLAEHLEPVQVADIFQLGIPALPVRQGIGAAQPGRTDWPALKRLTGAAVCLLTVMQLLLAWSPTEQQVVQQFTIAEPAAGATTQMLVSKSFNLKSATALEIELQAPDLANHWVEATVSLVNERTGRGYEFTRSLEYYQGNEDGENWSESIRTAEALLSDVPSGRYHFNLYPTVDPGTGTVTLSLSATTGVTLWSNYFLTLFGLGLVPLIVRWRYRSFEQERWENSNFSPYDTAD